MTPCRAVIRVRVPDRPGALGLVASRIGAVNSPTTVVSGPKIAAASWARRM